MRRFLLILAAALGARAVRAQGTAPAAPPPDLGERATPTVAPVTAVEAAAWRADLRLLATELPARHREPWAHLSRARWDSAVAAIDARIPQLAPHQVIAELMALVALVRDGHTTLAPERQARLRFTRVPLQFHDFADGLFVARADRAHAELAGARVVRVGAADAADALARLARFVSDEGGPTFVRARTADFLAMPELAHAAGLTDDPARLTLTLEVGGRERTVTFTGARAEDASADAMVEMRARGAPVPPSAEEPDRTWYARVLPGRTLFIEYRGVAGTADGETNAAFFARAFRTGDSADVTSVVVDLRANGGGDNGLNRHLVRAIVQRPRLDRKGHLFVLIGRRTFSAAQNLVNELAYFTEATFVGEPTGNAPNQYGDARLLTLPHSGLRVFVSSLLWESHFAWDRRTSYPPHVAVEETSADRRAGHDPALAKALALAAEAAAP